MESNTGEQNPPRRRHTSLKRRKYTQAIVSCLLLVLLGAGIAMLWYFGIELPFREAWNTMPQGEMLQLTQQEDGTVRLQWPQGVNTHYYDVLVAEGEQLIAQEDAPDTYVNLLYRTQIRGATSCILPNLSTGERMIIEVHSYNEYDTFFSQKIRPGEVVLRATGTFEAPVVKNLHWEPDTDTDTLTLGYDLIENQVCQLLISLDDGAQTWCMDLKDSNPVLHFGPDQTFPMPEYGQQYTFSFGSYIQTDTYLHQGIAYEGFSVSRETFLGTELNLKMEDEGLNNYTFTWDETKGEGYEVQKWNDSTESWTPQVQIARDGERFFSTGYLESYSDHRYRVVALGDQGTEPRELEFSTGATPVYSTIWPLVDLKVYGDADRMEVLGTAEKSSTFCVLDMKNDLFKIRYGDSYGWIDSNYCMINLPEFLGDLCSYNITNSVKSVFTVHGYEIPGITGTVVEGYEKVALGRSEQLVPLLYPTALKLEQAATAASRQGYRLKIYDAYRPGKASENVREVTEALLEQPLPETTYQSIPQTEMPTVAEGEILTYERLMTDDGQYSINYFISGFGSRHNYGVALDLTLEYAKNGRELEMQSAIHDLSYYSVLRRNKKNADALSRIMKDAGFATLVSEWWHFQDDDAIDTLELKALWSGISAEGWKADNTGWRYRRSSGSYYKDCTRTIDGVSYTFDAQGYVTP